jgi:hypothetical protein
VYVPLSFSDLEAQIVRRRADADLPSCLPSPEHLRNGIVMEIASTVHMRSLGFIDATGPLETAAGEAAAKVVEAVEAMVEAMAATAAAAAAAAGSEAARLAAAACSKALRLAACLTPTILYPRPDGGFDIIASEAVAQCKFRSSIKTPLEDVQQFANDCKGVPRRTNPGTLEHSQKCRLFYATRMEEEALQEANKEEIAVFLVDDKTGAVRPANDYAFALGLAADVQRGGDLSPAIAEYWSDVVAASKWSPLEAVTSWLLGANVSEAAMMPSSASTACISSYQLGRFWNTCKKWCHLCRRSSLRLSLRLSPNTCPPATHRRAAVGAQPAAQPGPCSPFSQRVPALLHSCSFRSSTP